VSKQSGPRARKRFGQNFLRDTEIIERIINGIAPKAGQAIVEVGPGNGALTELLLESSAWVTAIEIDRDLIPRLQARFSHFSNFNLLQTDALKLDYARLQQSSGQQQGSRQFRLVGNLPYNISTPLLFHLLSYADHIVDMTFMLQKEVVDRMSAEPGSRQYGRLSVMVQYRCQVEALFDVGPQAFSPVPKVWSAIVRLRPHQQMPYPCVDEKTLQQVVTQAFSMRRKTVRNALRAMFSEDQLRELGVDPQARPEFLSLADYVRLTNNYHSRV